jgi:2',3'-cyclic-nucleotide 2'-phosphodiesterase (5'-nucleotidase family)
MSKKLVPLIVMSVFFATTGVVSTAGAAAISNGVSCLNSGASKSVKVNGVNKVYLCTGNPSQAGVKGLEWTLKTCVTYWAAAQNSQDSINQQRSLVQSMSEPDKTNYGKQLDASQKQLDKVKATIASNHCKRGL